MRARARSVLPTLLLVLHPLAPLAAQEIDSEALAVRELGLPEEFREELLRVMDSGASERYARARRIGEEEEVVGDVAASGGPLVIEGRVLGSVAMLDGDVHIERSAYVEGDVIVVGGEARLARDAVVGGTVVSHESPASRTRYARRDHHGLDENDRAWRDHHLSTEGGARLSLRAGPTYNRVEGLPIMFGPGIRTGGARPLHLEGLAIWRTGASESLGTDRFGYRIRAEQYLDPRGRWTLGGSAYSIIDPIDPWRTSDLETSLAAIGFREDYRDHFERVGWSAFVTARPIRPLELRIEYRDAEHSSSAAGDPWSIFNGSDAWRPEPIVAEGEFRSVVGSAEIDTRSPDGRGYDHSHGAPETEWFAGITVEHGVGGNLVRPALLRAPLPGDPGDTAPSVLLPAREFSTDITTGFVDLRQYTPVTRRSWLDLRVVAGGNLADEPLPPQFRHAVGGVGTLPGYPFLSGACGGLEGLGSRDGALFVPSFGCDRFLLGQIQYRGSFDLDFGFGDSDRHERGDGGLLGPSWTVFIDAARGWSSPSETDAGRTDTDTLYDAGIGLSLDDIGLYFAVPLGEEVEREWRFTLRIGPRF